MVRVEWRSEKEEAKATKCRRYACLSYSKFVNNDVVIGIGRESRQSPTDAN